MIIQKEDILREERKTKGSLPLRFSIETGGRRRFLRDICRGEKRGNEFGGNGMVSVVMPLTPLWTIA